VYGHVLYVAFWLAFAMQFNKKISMNKLKLILMKHPTRRKYALIAADIIFILIAIKIFINYTNILQAIDDASMQSNQQELQLEFTKNFEIPYEKSQEEVMFNSHENDILLP
jgi:hypothetical protein